MYMASAKGGPIHTIAPKKCIPTSNIPEGMKGAVFTAQLKSGLSGWKYAIISVIPAIHANEPKTMHHSTRSDLFIVLSSAELLGLLYLFKLKCQFRFVYMTIAVSKTPRPLTCGKLNRIKAWLI